MQRFDSLDDRPKLAFQRWIEQIWLVNPRNGTVGWDRDGFHVVDLTELFLLGLGRPRHPGKLFVHPEQVLVSDVSHRLVFFLNRHVLFGFNGLVQTV